MRLENYIKYIDSRGYSYYICLINNGEYVDIHLEDKISGYGAKVWIHSINKDGSIRWRSDDWLEMTDEVRENLNRIVGLIAFL